MKPYEICRAYAIRRELIKTLGGECAECGSKRKLEINHIFERTWKANRFNMYQRMLKYRKEAELGIVNLLCESCNKCYRPLPLTNSVTPF